jgi:hypothetical protein
MAACFQHLLKMEGPKHVIILAGDYVLETAWLHETIRKAVYPSQYWLLPRHSMEFLDKHGMVAMLDWFSRLTKLNQRYSWEQRDLLRKMGNVKQVLVWQSPQKSWPTERIRAVVDERRRHFCEAGPAEIPFAWALAERDPV